LQISLIRREVGDGLSLLGEAWVVYTDGCIGAVLTPPLNDFLEKGVFWSGRKEVSIEVSSLCVKQDEYRHRRGFWWGSSFHMFVCFRESISCFGSRNFSVIDERSLSPYSGMGGHCLNFWEKVLEKRVVGIAVGDGIPAEFLRKSSART